MLSELVELFFLVENSLRKKELPNMQVGRCSLATRRKKRHSKGSAVVQHATQKESGSAQGCVFQGRAREDGEISAKEGDSKMGQPGG